MAVDLDGDGIPDVFDMTSRVVLMEVTRVLDAAMARRRNEFQAAASREERGRSEAQRRLSAARETSRASLAPVQREDWWESASVEAVGRKYLEARGWAESDPSFRPVVDTIERQARKFHGLPPERIADQAVIADREPLTFETARQVAAVAAPAWYRADERIVSGELGERETRGSRKEFIDDMTALRDRGPQGLDTPGAQREWARYLGTPALIDGPKQNESSVAARERLNAVAAHVWADTKEERAAAMVPRHVDLSDMPHPLEFSDALRLGYESLPQWVTFTHERGAVQDNPSFEAERARRFAEGVEVFRDTGTLSHPYMEELRFTARDEYGLDSSVGPAAMSEAERLRFGGVPSVPPITEASALAMLREHAPIWYQEPVLATLAPDSPLGDVDRAALLDTTRADMQHLRDRGTLDTPNARELWASTQDVVAGHSVDAVWESSRSRRAEPEPLTREQREQYTHPERASLLAEGPQETWGDPESTDTTKLPRVERKAAQKASSPEAQWDSPERRQATEARINKEFGRDAAIAFRTADVSMGRRGSRVTAGTSGGDKRAPGRSMVNAQTRGKKNTR